jgi:hypothetical protein
MGCIATSLQSDYITVSHTFLQLNSIGNRGQSRPTIPPINPATTPAKNVFSMIDNPQLWGCWDLTPDTVCTGTTIEIFQNGVYRSGKSGPVACLSQSAAQFKLHALAGTASVANVARVLTRETMSVSQVRESDFRKRLRDLPL